MESKILKTMLSADFFERFFEDGDKGSLAVVALVFLGFIFLFISLGRGLLLILIGLVVYGLGAEKYLSTKMQN